MKHFTRHPSKVTAATDILSFKCPGCKNKTLYSAEQDVHKVADVDENELFICDECGGEFRAHPQYNGSIRFTESIESATSVDDKKIDRRLSSTSKRYKGYRISLDNRHECYNIYDPHGELEDHGFKSVDDAMAHIDELVSIESATDVDEIPDFNDWLYDKYGVGDADMSDADMSDDDWEYYHDKYLKETGQEKYMSGNVYSSKQPGVRRKSTHRPVTAAKKRTTRQGEFDDRRVRNKVDSSTDIDLSEYDYSGNVDGYFVYRKVVTQPDGSKKGMWVAQDQDEKNPPFSITYDQARGFDPINDTSGTKKLAKWLGKRLLPNSVEASDDTPHDGIFSAEAADDYEDDIQEISQEFTSENTSINSSKLPAIFKMISLEPGTINIDYGGGRFDNVADYLTQFDVINLVYDPYNRTPEHNKEVIRTVRKAGGADTATCSNVLNVIKEPEVRQNVLQNIKKLVKPNGTVYITVYEGSGRNNEGPTKSGYQLNRKTEGYLDEIKQVFPDAVRKGKLIVAHPNGSAVTSAEDLSYDALTCEDCTYDLWTLVQDDSGKWVREDKIGTYDDYDEAETVAESIAKDTPCQVIEVGPNGLALVWTSKVSDPAIIEWLHDEYTMGNTKYSQLVSDLVNNFSLSTDEADQIISDWIDKDEDVHLEYDEDIDANTDVVEGASGRKHSIKTLHDALLNRASQIMRMQGFPLNEIADYLVVDIQPAEDGWLNCEVRAELSYEGMSEMIDALNPIVQKYDKDAYFDHVTGGIISAYLPSGKFNAIQSATDTNSSKVFELVQYTPDSGENGPAGDDFDVVDWGEFESEEAAKAHWSAEIQDGTRFVREGNPSDYIEDATVLGAWGVDDYPEPPESDEPEERNSREEIIIDLDDDIVVEDDGNSVEFLRDPAFLEDEDEWTPEDEPMFQIDDGDSVYEHVMDLIIDSIPAVDGKYHIKGRLKLVYDVTLSYYYEGTSEEDQTTELNRDGCTSDYDNYRSEVIELDVTEI